jgi:hypothetical protein
MYNMGDIVRCAKLALILSDIVFFDLAVERPTANL